MSKKLRTRRKKNKGESEGAESATIRDNNSEVSQAAYSNFMSEASFIGGGSGSKVIRPMSVR